MIIQALFLLALSSYTFLFPRTGLLLYVVIQGLVSIAQLFTVLGLVGVPSAVAQVGQLIIFALVLRSLVYGLGRIFISKHNRLLTVTAFAFICWAFLSLLYTDYPGSVMHELQRLIKFVFLVYAIYANVHNKVHLHALAMTMIYTEIGITVVQVLLYGLTGINIQAQGQLFVLPLCILYLTQRTGGVMLHLGLFMVIALILANIILVASRRSFIVLSIVILATSLFHFSRRTTVALFFVSLLGYLTFDYFASEFFYYRIESLYSIGSFDNSSWSGREKLWVAGWQMVQESPLFGKGYGVSKSLMDYYSAQTLGIEDLSDIRMHNTYLKAWAEIGLVGMILFFIMMIAMVKSFYKISVYFKRLNDQLLHNFYFSLFALTAAYIPVAFFGWSGYLDKDFWFLIVLAQIGFKLDSVDRSMAAQSKQQLLAKT